MPRTRKTKILENYKVEYYTIARDMGSYVWYEGRPEFQFSIPEPAEDLAKRRTVDLLDETEAESNPFFVIRRTERVKIERV